MKNICKIARSRLARLKSKRAVHVFCHLNLLALSLIFSPLKAFADPVKQQSEPAQTTQPQTQTTPLSKNDQPTPSQTTVDLNPDPNRLAVPKTPLEVGIKTTQGISLKQTLELATRNNRELEQACYEVENAFLSLQSQREQVAESQVGVDSAQEGLRLARLRLQAGVGTQTDVVQSQRDLTNAQSNLSQAIIGYNRALVQLQRSVTRL